MKEIPDKSIDAIICDLPYGTTGVACIKTGRKFIGIEKERKYFDISIDRVNKAYAEMSQELFGVNDGK
jgi:DNA modification methylase